jgi:hypothetical protein
LGEAFDETGGLPNVSKGGGGESGFVESEVRVFNNFWVEVAERIALQSKGGRGCFVDEIRWVCEDPRILVRQQLLIHSDLSKPFILSTDVSDYGLGAVLSQEIDGERCSIQFTSKELSPTQRSTRRHRKNAWPSSGLANDSSTSSKEGSLLSLPIMNH